ncbi:MAG: c-type cytochrome biogenesis protein CcmI [Burkholderiaceae bacterium]
MTFWILLGLLCVLSVGAVAWPLLRKQPEIGLDVQESQLAVMRDRRREIDDEQAAGRLTEAEAEEARNNLIDSLAQTLPAESGTAPSASSPSVGPRRVLTAATVAMLLPTLAFVVYQQVGEPMIGASPHLVDVNTMPSRQEIDNMVAQVIKATEDTPEDGQAWLALGQVRQAQRDYPAAAEAFGRAAALLPPNARLLAEQAEMQWLAQGRDFAGKPEQLLRQALTIEPGELKTNGLIAAYYMESGQQPAALPHLRTLLAAMSPDSEEGKQVGQLVDQIEANIAALKAAGSQGGAAPPPIAQANSNPGSQTNSTDKPAGDALLTGRIELSGEPVPAGAVLFISVRAAQGPRMPFAALRIPDPSLPMDFSLSDANAMSPQRRLSDAAEVVVEARLSLSGNAIRQTGDRFGQSDAGSNNRQGLVITIDQTVP